MPKIIISGKGGCGKSTLTTLLSKQISANCNKVLIVDVDESNLSLATMLGLETPNMSLLDYLGGRTKIVEKLMNAMKNNTKGTVPIFNKKLNLSNLPPQCSYWNGNIGLVRVGKIEHSMEGCACPMGAVARSFLNELVIEDNQWVLVDTDAGVEHFGRGVLEGADLIIMVVDTSYESILLAEKGKNLAEEAQKNFKVVLNKVNNKTKTILYEELTHRNIPIIGSLNYSHDIIWANLIGKSSELGELEDEINNIFSEISNSFNLV